VIHAGSRSCGDTMVAEAGLLKDVARLAAIQRG
jgi:hypothetical protein